MNLGHHDIHSLVALALRLAGVALLAYGLVLAWPTNDLTRLCIVLGVAFYICRRWVFADVERPKRCAHGVAVDDARPCSICIVLSH